MILLFTDRFGGLHRLLKHWNFCVVAFTPIAVVTIKQQQQTPPMDPQISEQMTELNGLLKKVLSENDTKEQILGLVAKARDKQTDQKPSQRQKLRTLYKNAIQNHESESRALREALNVVVEVRQALRLYQKKLIANVNSNPSSGGVRRGALMKILQQSASALPLFIPDKCGEQAPPLCGRIPAEQSYQAKSGDLVAAYVPSPDGDGTKVWVLGEVLQYILGAGKYEIDDIDEEQKERHSIGRRRVIPLPIMRANPSTNPEALFSKGSSVLALYPQTTCFYGAIIDKPPEDPSQDYMVSFEDPTYTEGYSPPFPVPQRYVIASRDPRK